MRGKSLSDLLGAYSVVGEGGYDVGDALRFWLWHVEELTLYVAVVPVIVLVVLLARGPRLPLRLQEHLAATVALVLTSTAVVGAFASRFAPDRVQDRYLFFCAPLLLVAVLGWIAIGAPRPLLPLAVGSALALVLVVAFPYARFIGEPAKSDTLGLIPLWTANEHLLGGSYRVTVVAVALALVALRRVRAGASGDRRAARPARTLPRPLAPGLVRAERRAPLRRGGALPGDPRHRARLARHARRGRDRRRSGPVAQTGSPST